ncbi:MAG TPA: putative Ig domain-containing protein [Methylomirabilota bacterium]|nr:putative Ig domain-containing protein [Methylomirabilota bacterium]
MKTNDLFILPEQRVLQAAHSESFRPPANGTHRLMRSVEIKARSGLGVQPTHVGCYSRRFGQMKFFVFLATLLSFVLPGHRSLAQAPGPLVWSAGPQLPSPRTDCAAVLAPDNAVLLLGGASPAGSQIVPRLAANATAWTTAPEMEGSRIAPGAVRLGAWGILVFGGVQGGEATDEALRYDYYFGDSQDAEKLQTPRARFAFAADTAGRAYAIGGQNASGQTLASVERYDSGADQWTFVAPLPAARWGACAVATTNGFIYVMGGSEAGSIRANTYRYNIAANAWEELAPLPLGVREAAAVLMGERIYVLGGVAATGRVSSVQVYNLGTAAWAFDTDLPAARSSHAAALRTSGEILVAGGYDAAGQPTATVFTTQRLNEPETAPVITSAPVTTASLDRPYSYDVNASGNPPPTFALEVAPAGMSIDAGSGLISWQPVAGQLGVQAVTVRASNRAGQATQSFNITVVADTIAPTPPASVQVVAVTTNSVDLTWTAATDANGVASYRVYRQYRCGFRGIQRCYALVQSGIGGTNVTISGLPPLTSYTYTVRAVDAAGLESGNSPLVSFRTLSRPVSFYYTHNGVQVTPVSSPANSLLEIHLSCSANPAATFSIVSGPPAMTLDPFSGLASWTPTPADVGTNTVVFRATNSEGSADLTVTINVLADIPRLSVQQLSGPAVAGVAYAAQVHDASHTPSTFALVAAPSGMNIEPGTGLIHWLPTPDQAGQTVVTIRATNDAGPAEITYGFYAHFTGPVSDIVVTNLTELYPVASWLPPLGTGADRTAGYEIVVTARYRNGRAWRTQRLTYNTSADNPSVELTGLTSGRAYSLSVYALDAAGNRGLANTNPVSFTPRPALPVIGWTVRNANGSAYVVAEQEAILQLTNHQAAFGAATYTLVSAPAGFTLDPVTGTGHWTPSASDVGTTSVTVRASNQVGPKDTVIPIQVYFSGPVLNATALRVADTASVSWSPPVDNVFPVVSNRVTRHWQWGSRSYSSTILVAGDSATFALVPTGAVWHKGVTIAPVDAAGHVGVPTPLIPYNGALPADLPPAEPAWIENLTLQPDGTPLLNVGGVPGQAVQVEVSTDLGFWETAAELTIGPESTAQFPDMEGRNLPSGFYRLRVQ